MKIINKMYNFNLLCIISLIIILFYCIVYNKTAESFVSSIENKIVNKDDFNELFETNIIELPDSITQIGFYNNETYVVTDLTGNNPYNIVIKYWIDNIDQNINKDKYYFLLCTFDGYRERIPYSNTSLEECIPEINRFKNIREIQNFDYSKMPIFHKNKKIFCFSKHINDTSSICIPDFHYIEQQGYVNTLFKEIDNNYIKWEDKQYKCVWRGNVNNSTNANLINYNKTDLTQRQYFKKLYDSNTFNNINADNNHLSIPEQLQYKYILDIDGYSNTWDATVWKLYSGSILLKTNSIWKQWYYDDGFAEWIHYVPVENDFSNLNEIIDWCINNDVKCKQIIENAKKFVLEKLNWEYVKNYTTNTVKQYI
jgi:hypothetical protein